MNNSYIHIDENWVRLKCISHLTHPPFRSENPMNYIPLILPHAHSI